MGSWSEASGTEEEDPVTLVKFRKSAKRNFTQLTAKVKTHVESAGDHAALRVHQANLVELYDECQRLQTRYVTRANPTGEALNKTQQWSQDWDAVYLHHMEILDHYLGEQEEEDATENPTRSDNQIQAIEYELQRSNRKLAEELEDSRLTEARRA